MKKKAAKSSLGSTPQAKEQKRRAKKYLLLWMAIYDDQTDNSDIPQQRLIVTREKVRRMTPGDTIENFCKTRMHIDYALELFRAGDSKIV